LITLLTRFGAHVSLAHPEGYLLLDEPLALARRNAEASGGSFRVVDQMDEAFAGAHAVYPKSWGPHALMRERVAANRAGDKPRMAEIEAAALAQNARHRDWICDERRMATTAGALYMHCLPADVGAEVTPGVMERFRVALARQANKKLFVIMAALAAAKLEGLEARLDALAP
jgi:ornithine carbamoyltransferase